MGSELSKHCIPVNVPIPGTYLCVHTNLAINGMSKCPLDAVPSFRPDIGRVYGICGGP